MIREVEFMPWWRALHGRLEDCQGPVELFAELQRQALGLGFDCVVHGHRPGLPFSQAGLVFNGNYPGPWFARQVHQPPAAVAQLARGAGFALWQHSDATGAAVPGDGREWGLAWGASVAGWSPDRGLRVLCVASRTGRPAPADLPLVKAALQALTQGLDEYLSPFLLPDQGPRLSERETEILRWLADGKCSKGTAQVLGLSENTVNWHIKRILRRSGSSNRVVLAARAAALGLI